MAGLLSETGGPAGPGLLWFARWGSIGEAGSFAKSCADVCNEELV